MGGSSGILAALSTSTMHPWCASYCKISQLIMTPCKTPRYEPPLGPLFLMFSQWDDDGGHREVAMLQNNQTTYYRTVDNHVLLRHHLYMFMSLTLGFSSTTRGFHKMIFTSTILYTHLLPVIILAFTRIWRFTVSPFLLLALTRKELKQKQGGVLNSKSSHSVMALQPELDLRRVGRGSKTAVVDRQLQQPAM